MRRILSLLVMSCVVQTTIMASSPLELKWTELSPLISGNRVELTLDEGTRIIGEAISVREDTLVMDVKRSSGTKLYAKGNAAIPRNAITLIKLQRTRGAWGRSMGTVIGVLGGMGGGGLASSHVSSAGAAVGIFVAVAAGTAVAGYYVGRGLDRRATLIRIMPE